MIIHRITLIKVVLLQSEFAGKLLKKEPKNRVWEQLMFMDLNGH
jgi:hypothetical protein